MLHPASCLAGASDCRRRPTCRGRKIAAAHGGVDFAAATPSRPFRPARPVYPVEQKMPRQAIPQHPSMNQGMGLAQIGSPHGSREQTTVGHRLCRRTPSQACCAGAPTLVCAFRGGRGGAGRSGRPSRPGLVGWPDRAEQGSHTHSTGAVQRPTRPRRAGCARSRYTHPLASLRACGKACGEACGRTHTTSTHSARGAADAEKPRRKPRGAARPRVRGTPRPQRPMWMSSGAPPNSS